jgi:hypothetical protein
MHALFIEAKGYTALLQLLTNRLAPLLALLIALRALSACAVMTQAVQHTMISSYVSYALRTALQYARRSIHTCALSTMLIARCKQQQHRTTILRNLGIAHIIDASLQA